MFFLKKVSFFDFCPESACTEHDVPECWLICWYLFILSCGGGCFILALLFRFAVTDWSFGFWETQVCLKNGCEEQIDWFVLCFVGLKVALRSVCCSLCARLLRFDQFLLQIGFIVLDAFLRLLNVLMMFLSLVFGSV